MTTFADIERDGRGVIANLPNGVYHAGPGLSVSGIKRFRRSPFHYRSLAQAHGAPPSLPTPAMMNGTLVHCAVLEPAELMRRYVVGPEISRTSHQWRDFARDHIEQQVITRVQYDAAMRQATALKGLEEVATLLEDGQAEVSAYWTDVQTGVLCKCRPDHVSPVAMGTGCILVDVKTAGDASAEAFARSATNLGYHLQAAWYCDGYAQASGLQVHGMVFAVVESEFPHAVAAYMLDDVGIEKGRAAVRDALNRYVECERADAWPGYPAGITVLQLPPWA